MTKHSKSPNKAKRVARAARSARWRRFQDRKLGAASEGGMSVHGDPTGRWFVCRISDGAIVASDFASNALAWAWIDDHGNKALEIKRDRISNAARQW